MKLRQALWSLVISLPLFASGSVLHAQTYSEAGFQSYLQRVAAKARVEGVREATISRSLSGLTLSSRVVELDSAQPGRQSAPPPMAPYLRTHVDNARINGGRNKLRQVGGLLPAIERRYGVPPQILTAIWGS